MEEENFTEANEKEEREDAIDCLRTSGIWEVGFGREKIGACLGQVLERLPYDVLDRLAYGGGETYALFVLSSVGQVFSFEVRCASSKRGYTRSCHVIVLSPTLEDEPEDVVIGTIAHEIAHAILKHGLAGHMEGDNEKQADDLACEWGFASEIRASNERFPSAER